MVLLSENTISENTKFKAAIDQLMSELSPRLLSIFGSKSKKKSELTQLNRKGAEVVKTIERGIYYALTGKASELIEFIELIKDPSLLTSLPKSNRSVKDVDILLPRQLTDNFFYKLFKTSIYNIKMQRHCGAGEIFFTLFFGDSVLARTDVDCEYADGTTLESKTTGSISPDPTQTSFRIIDNLNVKYYGSKQPAHRKTPAYLTDKDVNRSGNFLKDLYGPTMEPQYLASMLSEWKLTATSEVTKDVIETRSHIIGYYVLQSYRKKSKHSFDMLLITDYNDREIQTVLLKDFSDRQFIKENIKFKVQNSRGNGNESRADGMVTLGLR